MEVAKAMEMPAARARGVSKGQTHSAEERERVTLGPDSSLEHPPTSKELCYKNPRGPIAFEDVLGENHQTLRIKTILLPWSTGLLGSDLTTVPLASSPTTLCLTSLTPDTLSLFKILIFAVLLATTGLLQMLFSPPRMLFCLPSPS